ncbi:uncharacterized protein LOC116849194 [Odontomachus brunneus]|uniref:uncharacterized protein LOC116849194 n=1 Tax=Odontomachus brunneus TaxID=486640 RepID=UPI0013F1C930|nr:uncharacterized protein LOC116849194 [Odontomachus brunneus]
MLQYAKTYIGLKFDQINQCVQKFESYNEQAVNYGWRCSTSLPRQILTLEYPKFKDSEYVTWVVIHLHLELRKISQELNSMFGLQMTIKMGTYFALIVIASDRVFNIIFTHNYGGEKKINLTLIILFIIINIFRLLIINYMCERVSNKANATRDVICKIVPSTTDNVTRENISQILLQMRQAPLKFHGLRLFQFGSNFFRGFSSSATTVIVILVQSHTST